MKHEEALENMAAERYILNELSDQDRSRFEEHFFDCMECASDIRVLTQLKAGVKSNAYSDARIANAQRERSPSWREKWALWWFRPGIAFAAIGALAASASFTSWQYLELRRATEPQMVASIMLRPETRGETPQVSAESSGKFVLLEADLPGASGNLRWRLQREGSNDAVAEGTGVAPAPGASFKILASANVIERGSYQVTVQTADGVRTWTFRFNASGT